MRRFLCALLALTATAISVAPAAAQYQCVPRKVIAEQLKQKYGERVGGIGLAGGVLYEVWSAPETGTFTILITTPKNISCIMAAGKDWSFREIETPVEREEH